MRYGFPVLAVLALAACDPQVPDSAAGVGFDSYSEYSARRETAIRNEMTVRAPAQPAAAETDAAPLSATAPLPPVQGTVQGTVQAAAPVDPNNPGISDEQSFAAVSARETIQSDRERLEAQRGEYVVVAPEPLPQRSGASGPNIVQYALGTTNQVGQQVYRRGAFGKAQFLKNCARYASPDLAQEAFLAAGGPEKDRLNLDPDGDGFACYWDPTPFRQAVNSGG